METSSKLIDIDDVLASKNPKLAKWIPRFLVNYLKRIAHEDFVNDFVERNKEKFGLEFVDQILFEFGAKLKINGLENIPEKERCIVASNHPLGGMDGIALMHTVGRKRKDIVFPVNDILMYIPNLRPLFIPINKHGSNADNVRIINETFESDMAVLYFPAGLVSRKQKGVIKDLEWKKTFISRAVRFKRDIIPVHMDGRNRNFFYNLANLRKRLNIKANLEMLYLVDESVRYKDKTINVNIGKPIPYQVFDKSKSHAEWATLVKEHVYKLSKDIDAKFEVK